MKFPHQKDTNPPTKVRNRLLENVSEGQDVTEQIGVTKYEPPAPKHMGEWRTAFPGFVPKTDEMRVQSVPAVLEEMRRRPYAITLKYDGTSATYCIDPRDGEFHACGRNHSICDGENHYWQMARRYGIAKALQSRKRYILQGEIVGPGIQKNPLGLKETAFFAFNVYDLTTAEYLGHTEGRMVLEAMGIPAVQTLETGESFAYGQESLLALAEGKYDGTNNEREGIVIRPLTETRSEILGGRLSFKAISNRYLLKETD